MVAALTDNVEQAGRDEAVRVVVIDAAGDHFCSGFDIVGRNADKTRRPRVGNLNKE